MTTAATRRPRRDPPAGIAPLRVASIAVEGTVTRRIRLEGDAGDAWLHATREAMLKRGCLRDRAHQGQCLNCALLPQCAVWPLVAPADPTRRQPGAFVRSWVPLPPLLPPGVVPEGTRVTHALSVVQDSTFAALWGRFGAAYVQASRQLAEWGFGQPVPTPDGPARRGAISVSHTYWRHPITGEAQPFSAEGENGTPPLWFEEDAAVSPGAGGAPSVLIITCVTPLRLVAAGETRRMPDLALLVRRIGERVTTLCTAMRLVVPPSVGEDAIAATIALTERVRIATDETDWIGGRKDGGLVGRITLNGSPDDLALLLPVLRWGQALGAGKGAQAGGGRITVQPGG